MSYVLAIIGWADTPRTEDAISDGIEWHLHPDHQAIWTDVKRPRFAGGMRLVAKIAGAKVLALTGQLVGHDPREDDPIERDGRVLRYRYDVRWDERPDRWVPVEDLGPPFNQVTRSTRFIERDDFLRVYRALHGSDPPRQLS
ncbi:MAG TPA: hypothetical protein VHG69_06705 [Thermoleophilaceae bacterium]|nr:hypothetical protein [Thermoleophilaceae bacterium]